MSSLPNQPTFLESYKKVEPNEKLIYNENKMNERYKREINFLEEEIKYWKREYELSLNESIIYKLQKLNTELFQVKKIYENYLNNM